MMKISYFKNVNWLRSEDLNCFIGVEQNLPNNDHADIVYAKLLGFQTLHSHYHIRPVDSGYESFFFFNGADINIHLKGKVEHIKSTTPFHITFMTREEHGLENLSGEDLIFEVLCAPKHQEGEEVLIDGGV